MDVDDAEDMLLHANYRAQAPQVVELPCVIAGRHGALLAEEVAGLMGLPVNKMSMNTVSGRGVGDGGDTECKIQVCESVRGRDVYIVQSVGSQDNAEERTEFGSVNDHLVELMLIVSAARRASAERICAVVPYYPYCRQTRKQTSRVPISAADVAQMLEEAGVDHVVTIDVHAEQIPGFFSPRCAVDTLPFTAAAARFFWEKKKLHSPVVLAPHATGVPRAKEFLDTLLALHRAESRALAAVPEAPVLTPPGSGDHGAHAGGSDIDPNGSGDVDELAAIAASAAEAAEHAAAAKKEREEERGEAPSLAMLLSAPEARRGAHGKKRLELIGEVAGSDVIIVDDIIDSGNTVRANPLARNYSRRANPPRNSLTRPAFPPLPAGVPLVRRAARARRPSRLRVCDARPLLGGGLRCHRRVRRRTRRREQLGAPPPPPPTSCRTLPPLTTPPHISQVPLSAPPDHPIRRKLVVLSAAPTLAHRIAELAGLPPPDVSPEAPTFALTGVARSRSAEERASSRASRGASQPASRQASSGAPPTPTTAQRSVST